MKHDKLTKYRFPLNLQTFSEPETNDPIDPEPTPEPKTVTMTQDELNALIAKEKAKAKKPYANYDEISAKLAELEKAEEQRKLAEMSEQERIQAELSTYKKAAEEAEAARSQALELANQRSIKAEFKLAAAGANIRADALEDAYILVDKSGITVDEGGNVVGVSEALEALVTAKPYLIEVKQPQNPKIIGEPNNPKEEERKTLQAQLDDAKKRKDFGKVVELSNKLINLK